MAGSRRTRAIVALGAGALLGYAGRGERAILTFLPPVTRAHPHVATSAPKVDRLDLPAGQVIGIGPLRVPGLPPDRLVRVYVPRRARPVARPLLVLFDGQNVFEDGPSYAGGWHVHSAVERLAREVSPPVVVGLDHGYERRVVELSPFEVTHVPAGSPDGSGQLDILLTWLADELLPDLQRHLATTDDPRRVVIGGSSMGGLAALYAQLARPDRFGGALAMSPALWTTRGAMTRWMNGCTVAPWGRIYLDAGTREARGRLVSDARDTATLLRERGCRDLLFREDTRGAHRESDWRRRLPAALRYFFGVGRAAARSRLR